MKISLQSNRAMSLIGGIIVLGLAVVIIGGMTILVGREMKRIPQRKLPPDDNEDKTNTVAQLQAIYGTNAIVLFPPPIIFDDPDGLMSTNIQDYSVESSTDLVHWAAEPEVHSLDGETMSMIASNRMLPQQFFRMKVKP